MDELLRQAQLKLDVLDAEIATKKQESEQISNLINKLENANTEEKAQEYAKRLKVWIL